MTWRERARLHIHSYCAHSTHRDDLDLSLARESRISSFAALCKLMHMHSYGSGLMRIPVSVPNVRIPRILGLYKSTILHARMYIFWSSHRIN